MDNKASRIVAITSVRTLGLAHRLFHGALKMAGMMYQETPIIGRKTSS